MKIDLTFLRSKVARRIFFLFISCALIPITILAVISYTQVTEQLNEQSRMRLHWASKNVGMAIYERLLFIEAEIKMAGKMAGIKIKTRGEEPAKRLGKRLIGLVAVTETGKDVSFFGNIADPPQLESREREHVDSGESLLFVRRYPDQPPRIFMSMLFGTQDSSIGALLAEINPLYLWGISGNNKLPARTEFCVLDQSNKTLYFSLSGPVPFSNRIEKQTTSSTSRRFEYEHNDIQYLASYWTIFLKNRFFAPKWTVVLSESKSDVLAPLAKFKKTFPLVMLMSFWVVLLLSIRQIRKYMVPLEKLQEGTWRISSKEFDTPVVISSGDEFEDLAISFNTMSRQLGKQFNTLSLRGKIDRAILSALDRGKIVDTVLSNIHGIFPCDHASMTLLDAKDDNRASIYIKSGNPENIKRFEIAGITPEEEKKFRENPKSFFIEMDENIPRYLEPLTGRGIHSFLILPVFLKNKLAGFIILGENSSFTYSEEALEQTRQLADQVAVAFSNANLIEDLDQLNWGTLTALARAVDAKSPWTAGHSERVTKLALNIGRTMGLTPEELDNLHRGGLLHDIGKIATPHEILDKPGKLTDDEYRVICEHPAKGRLILEPIAAYADVMPIVVQHHECFDGSGYPDGLSGEAISLGGRILAVADVYDALISKRPYRSGLRREQVVEFIREKAGTEFDPNVVQALLAFIAMNDIPEISSAKENPFFSSYDS